MGEEQELANLVNCMYKTSSRYGMKISAKKKKLMTNSIKPIEKKIKVSGQDLETVKRAQRPKSHSKNGTDSSSTGTTETSVDRQNHQSITQAEATASPVNHFMCIRHTNTKSRTAQKNSNKGDYIS